MSGIRSTQGPLPTNLDTGRVNVAAQQQPVTPVTPSSPPGGHSGAAVNVASSIANLSEGARIAAIVTAKTNAGTIVFKSDIGSFSMNVSGPIPVGSQLILEISGLDQVIHAKLLSKDGTPFNPPINVNLTPADSAQLTRAGGYQLAGQQYQAQHSQQSLPQSSLENLQGLTRTTPGAASAAGATTPPATAAAAAPATGTPAAPQTGLLGGTIQAASVQGSTQTASAAGGAALYSQTPTPGNQAPQQPSLPPQPISPGGTAAGAAPSDAARLAAAKAIDFNVNARINSIPTDINMRTGVLMTAKVGDVIPLTVLSTAGDGGLQNTRGVYTGSVVATTGAGTAQSAGRTVHLQSAIGQFSFVSPANVAVGTQLQFSLPMQAAAFPLPPVALPANIMGMPALALSADWQNLREAVNHLARIDGPATQNFLSSLIPQAGGQLSSNLLFFLNALQLGGFENWVGRDIYQRLQTGARAGLLQGLDEDFAALQRMALEPGNNDWRHLLFPFFDGNNLKQLGLYYRSRQSDPEDPDSDKSTRFVIDLDLTQTGPIQLDGLFAARKFDLFLRSHRQLDDETRHNIAGIFKENLEITGISGQLVFQTVSPFPVNPGDEMAELPHPELDA